jgi:hypothetical protein
MNLNQYIDRINENSNEDLIDDFLHVSKREKKPGNQPYHKAANKPGKKVLDAIEVLENAGENMDTTPIKNARKIVIKYLVKELFGEDAEIKEVDEADDEYETSPSDDENGQGLGKGRSKKGRSKKSRSRRSRSRRSRSRKGRSRRR